MATRRLEFCEAAERATNRPFVGDVVLSELENALQLQESAGVSES
jgi:hypothetical protein